MRSKNIPYIGENKKFTMQEKIFFPIRNGIKMLRSSAHKKQETKIVSILSILHR